MGIPGTAFFMPAWRRPAFNLRIVSFIAHADYKALIFRCLCSVF